MKDVFWAVEQNRTETDIPFEQSSSSSGEISTTKYNVPFIDHKDGEGILIHPRLVLRMKVEKREMCWSDMSLKQNPSRAQLLPAKLLG